MSAFCCRHCGVELGETDGRRLVILRAVFVRRVGLRCAICDRVTVWHPPRENNATVQVSACGMILVRELSFSRD